MDMETLNPPVGAPTPPSLADQSAALDNREEMLRTLHLAYREVLDESYARTMRNRLLMGEDFPDEDRRLSMTERCDLGRRLALYWDIGRETLPTPAPRDIRRAHNEEIEQLLRDWRRERSAVNGDEGGEAVR